MTGPTSIFITGTDTDVGKTVIAAWLTYHLKGVYWKPIQSGARDGLDATSVAHLASLEPDRLHPSTYVLKAPLSPQAAADLEGVTIRCEAIQRPSTSKPLIIEGAGGVMVPLDNTSLMIDLIYHLGQPVIVVGRSGLGTINHTCLTLEALKRRGVFVLGVVLNGPPSPSNAAAIARISGVPVLASFPWVEDLNPISLQALPLTPSLAQAVFSL